LRSFKNDSARARKPYDSTLINMYFQLIINQARVAVETSKSKSHHRKKYVYFWNGEMLQNLCFGAGLESKDADNYLAFASQFLSNRGCRRRAK
jgi:hypothetical protein